MMLFSEGSVSPSGTGQIRLNSPCPAMPDAEPILIGMAPCPALHFPTKLLFLNDKKRNINQINTG